MHLNRPPNARERVDTTGMTHRGDPSTSQESAVVIARRLNELHGLVLAALREHGPMTDEELELLPTFRGFGPSTIRKRRSELGQMGSVVACGEKQNSRNRKMLIWRVV